MIGSRTRDLPAISIALEPTTIARNTISISRNSTASTSGSVCSANTYWYQHFYVTDFNWNVFTFCVNL
jgi:hypothetical protein